jgi:hypothetical protein
MLMWVALSDERLLLALTSAVILGSESCGDHDHILLFQIRDSPNLDGQVPLIISTRNRVAQLYPQALGSRFAGLRWRYSSPPPFSTDRIPVIRPQFLCTQAQVLLLFITITLKEMKTAIC